MNAPETPGATGLRVGFVPGVTLTKWRRIWAERLPRVPLEVVEVTVAEQRRVVDAAAVDLCFALLPIETDGVHVIRLYDETPVAWVAKDHPIALFESVTTADLADETVLTDVTPAALDAVTMADAVLAVPLSVARAHSRRDMVHRPVTDAPATTVALVWRTDADNPWIDEFIGIVRGRTANSSRTVRERSEAGDGASRVRGAASGGRPRRPQASGGKGPSRARRGRGR